MDKQTVSSFGWIIIVTVLFAVMIAFATPFGTYVGEGVISTAKGFVGASNRNLDENHIEEESGKWSEFLGDAEKEGIAGTCYELGHRNLKTVGKIEATCLSAGYSGDKVCGVCDEVIEVGKEVVAANHKNTVLQNKVDVTCTVNGYSGDKYCNDCEKVYEQGKVITASGHTTELVNVKTATCLENGYTGDNVCKKCKEIVTKGNVITAGGHITELRNKKDATCLTNGYSGDTVCKVCDTITVKGNIITASGHTSTLQGKKILLICRYYKNVTMYKLRKE